MNLNITYIQTHTCTIEDFRCANDFELCIPMIEVCNGVIDCTDKSDEDSTRCKV